jgi:hypothetical protein
MKRVIIFFWFCLLLASLISGCNEKKHGSIVRIPEQLKPYSVFQLGSYWIFKNETTDKTDSIFLLVPPLFMIHESSDGPSFEFCFLTYDSSLISNGGINWEQYWLVFTKRYGGPCLMAESFQPGYTDHRGFINIEKFDSLEINNKVYYDVINTQYRPVSFDRDTMVYTYYLAKSIGLIKFNLRLNSKDTNWSLLRYHVVQ